MERHKQTRITLSCGHEMEVDLPDDADERKSKLSWLKNFGMCEDCFYDWNWGQGRR